MYCLLYNILNYYVLFIIHAMQWLSLSNIQYMTHHNILYLIMYGSFIHLKYTYLSSFCEISCLHFKRCNIIQFNVALINYLNFRLVRIFVFVQKVVSCFTALESIGIQIHQI